MLATYQNGSFNVSIFEDGTRIMEGDSFIAEYPCSLDVKITNWCDSNGGCMAHCHERSNPNGIHGDLDLGFQVLEDLPAGVEIALGGGDTLSHPDLEKFLVRLRSVGLIPNITVSQYHIDRHVDRLIDYNRRGLIFGIGLSYLGINEEATLKLKRNVRHVVYHVIAGVHTVDQVKAICSGAKILVLGYKKFGNGVSFYSRGETAIDKKLYEWYRRVHELFKSAATLSFDNLAIEQLNIRRFFDKEGWEEFYSGNDGSISMYLDLVKREFARSSTSAMRFPIDGTIFEMFKSVKCLT